MKLPPLRSASIQQTVVDYIGDIETPSKLRFNKVKEQINSSGESTVIHSELSTKTDKNKTIIPKPKPKIYSFGSIDSIQV